MVHGYRCINCGSNNVTRAGDDFTCDACKYSWDVAHEQANAKYLRSQGREPATSIASAEEEIPAEAGEGAVFESASADDLNADISAASVIDAPPASDDQPAETVSAAEEKPKGRKRAGE